MKALAITHKGFEEVCSAEVSELIKGKGVVGESVVLFDAKNLLDLCLLCYKMQSVSKVLYLFDSFKFKDDFFKVLKEKIGKIKFSEFFDKDTSFVVRCLRIGEHKFSSNEVESTAGEFVIDKIKAKVDLENPDVIIYIYVYENNCYLGLDLAGFDLSKREYKIFSTPTSIRGTIAYSLTRLVDVKDSLLDPFSNSGEIAIEQALFFSWMSPHFYKKDSFVFTKLKPLKSKNFKTFFEKLDKAKKPLIKIFSYDEQMRNVKHCEKNAKIAGVNKYIKFSKTSVDWLDTKFDKNSIGAIVTYPPSPSRTKAEKEIEKLYQELFHQAEFVLKPKGRVVCLTKAKELLKKSALAKNFKVEKELEVWQGKQKLDVLVFGK